MSIEKKCLERLSNIFGIPVDKIKANDRFGVELQDKRAIFGENAIDDVVFDIYFVSNESIEQELDDGRIVVDSVEKYCAHMERCYKVNPIEVGKTLGLKM